jgi:hypothetical protein
VALALVRDLREHRVPASTEELADFETDVLAGFVLARASAGLADSTIRNDTGHLELIRDWFGRPLWEMRPADAASYFGSAARSCWPGADLNGVVAAGGAGEALDGPAGESLGRAGTGDHRHVG